MPTNRPGQCGEALTIHALREELSRFAEVQLESRLQELRGSILSEMRASDGRNGNNGWPVLQPPAAFQCPAPPEPFQPPKVSYGSNCVGSPQRTEHRTIMTNPKNQPEYDELAAGDGNDNEALETLLPPKEKGGIAGLIEGSAWNVVLAAVVVLSAMVIGFETDYMSRHWKEPSPAWFKILDRVFCIFFTVELAIHIAVEGFKFFSSRDRWWNWFDLIVVGLQLFEVSADLLHMDQDQNNVMTGLANIRVVRVVRVVRLGRVFHLVPSLRRLLTSISETIGHIWWPMILIFLVTYLYGVVFTNIVTNHKKVITEEQFEEQEELMEFYGTLDRSMLSLFETVSEGIHWGDVLKPLSEYCSPWLTLVFICYVAFVLFAMMNVITAFFVESSIEAAAMEHRNSLARSLWGLFGKHQGHGITAEEFYGQPDHPQMLQFYEELKLTQESAMDGKLFEILDADGSGSIDVDEMIHGCQRLLGAANQVDFAMFLKNYNKEVMLARQHREFVEALFWGMKPLGPAAITTSPTSADSHMNTKSRTGEQP